VNLTFLIIRKSQIDQDKILSQKPKNGLHYRTEEFFYIYLINKHFSMKCGQLESNKKPVHKLLRQDLIST